MKKCRYIPEADLPMAASAEQVQRILNAIRFSKYKIVGGALRQVVAWQTTTEGLTKAIAGHLQAGYRIFSKSVEDPPVGVLFFSANIRLDPESDEEEDDVYVEIRLRTERLEVVICDAHNHNPPGRARYPK